MAETAQAYPQSPYQVGDLVMFANRCQRYPAGMPVQEVDVNMFDVRLRVDNRWWAPDCFMSHAEWRRRCDQARPTH